MVSTSPSSGLESHPGVQLEEHLINTATFAEIFLQEKPAPIQQELAPVLKICALLHDIGKATPHFQKYLSGAESKIPEARHSLSSAVCTYSLLSEQFPDNLYPILGFLAVKRHHGNLNEIIDEVIFDEEDYTSLKKQLASIQPARFTILAQKLKSAGLPVMLTLNQIASWFDNFPTMARQIKRRLRTSPLGIEDYITANLIYSILLDADKSATLFRNNTNIFKRQKFPGQNLIKNYRQRTSFPPSPLNKLRDAAYNEAVNLPIDLNRRFYSLNLPTGMGKTLTALAFAFRLRAILEKETGIQPRIIYALPFLSIIDQNADIIEKILQTNGITSSTDIFLKHHHLADTVYKKEDDDTELTPSQAEILIEGWNSEIIITTFVQFFHTLITNRNRSLRKFHRLTNSIIILDEVQNIPIKYWLLLQKLLSFVAEKLNSYIIFATATEPLIFPKEHLTDIVINKERFFSCLDRIEIKQEIDNPRAIEQFADEFNFQPDKTYLFIFNTISAAHQFFDILNNKGYNPVYLSTHVVPRQRMERIKAIKEKRPSITVSTQLVEAGVDIDFDIVVRDFAPLDSIIQSAGRCNRNATKRGTVLIVKLLDQNKKPFYSYIYDGVLIDITANIIAGKKELKEPDLLPLLNEYYQQTQQRKSQQESKELLTAVEQLRYKSIDDRSGIADFQLITDEFNKLDVFIELDKEAQEIWQQFLKIRKITDPFQRREMFNKIRNQFYQYVISIPRFTANKPDEFDEIGYVPQASLCDYYNAETGFIIKNSKPSAIY